MQISHKPIKKSLKKFFGKKLKKYLTFKTTIINRTINPALKEYGQLREFIFKKIGIDRKYFFGLITYIEKLRNEVKKCVGNYQDYKSVNKQILELFEKDLEHNGKDKLSNYIISLAEERKKRTEK
jgi:hypothetical protein